MASDKVMLELPVETAVILKLAAGTVAQGVGNAAKKETDPFRAVGQLAIERAIGELDTAIGKVVDIATVAPATVRR